MKIENVEVFGLDRVFKTAKYPKSVAIDTLNNDLTPGIKSCLTCGSGEGHDNALKGIVVMFDLTMSNKAWVEAERYHFLDFVSSQSTMHKIAKFDIREQCNNYVDPRIIMVIDELKNKYDADPTPDNYLRILYNVPSGFELTAGMVTNYQQLKTIYHQRRYHRLPDWHMVCDWIETLPHSELITTKKENNIEDYIKTLPYYESISGNHVENDEDIDDITPDEIEQLLFYRNEIDRILRRIYEKE